jgi:putative salt-induced outer membrane protein YdiY
MRLRRLFPLVVAAVALHAVPCAADEIQLKNGDRLTGTVVSLDAGTLKFKTAHGDLSIAWPEVTALTVDDPILVTTTEGQPAISRSGVIDIASSTALARPEPPLTWTGGANAGLLQTSGNTDVNSLRVDADVSARAAANRYSIGADVNRAQDTGRETARNWSLSGNYDRFLNRRLYVNGNAIFTNDPFRDLDLRTALGVALGYQVLDTALTKLSVEGGLGWVNENFETAPDDRYTALREGAKLDVLLVGDRVTLFHEHNGYIGVTGEDNLFIKMKNGVRLGLVVGLVTTLQLDLDYDRSPAPGRRNTDRAFALTFGYRF